MLEDEFPEISESDLLDLEQINVARGRVDEALYLRDKVHQLEDEKIGSAVKFNQRILELQDELHRTKTALQSELEATKTELAFVEQRVKLLDAEGLGRSRKLPRGGSLLGASLFEEFPKKAAALTIERAVETEQLPASVCTFDTDMSDLRAAIRKFECYDKIETSGPVWSGFFHTARQLLVGCAISCGDVLRAFDISLLFSARHMKTYFCRFTLHVLYSILISRPDFVTAISSGHKYAVFNESFSEDVKELLIGSKLPESCSIIKNVIGVARLADQFDNDLITLYSLRILELFMIHVSDKLPIPLDFKALFYCDGKGLIYFYKKDDSSYILKMLVIRLLLLLSEDHEYVELFFSPISNGLGESLYLLSRFDLVSIIAGQVTNPNGLCVVEAILFLYGNWTLRGLVSSSTLFSQELMSILPLMMMSRGDYEKAIGIIGIVLHDLVITKRSNIELLFGSTILPFTASIQGLAQENHGNYNELYQALLFCLKSKYKP